MLSQTLTCRNSRHLLLHKPPCLLYVFSQAFFYKHGPYPLPPYPTNGKLFSGRQLSYCSYSLPVASNENYLLVHNKELWVTHMPVFLGLLESENCFQESCLRAAHVAVICLSSLYVKKREKVLLFCAYWSMSLHTTSSKTVFKHSLTFIKNLASFTFVCVHVCVFVYIYSDF